MFLMPTPNRDKIAFLSTDPIDKLFDDVFTGSFSVPAADFPPSTGKIATTTIINPRGENVLPIMQFSLDQSTWLDAGTQTFDEGSFLNKQYTATCYTTDSQIVVVGHNWTASSKTFYYRLVLISDD